MKKISSRNIAGFTLIELLVVVSIITMLSSVVFATLGTSRAKAMDAKKSVEVREVGTALNLYTSNTGKPLSIYKGGVVQDVASLVESGKPGYDETMQKLVDNKVLSTVPQSPDDIPYYYYYDPAKPDGASFFTYLKKAKTPVYTGNTDGLVKKSTEKCGVGETWNGQSCETVESGGNAFPAILVFYPNGGEVFSNGSNITITWNKALYSGDISIELLTDNPCDLRAVMCVVTTQALGDSSYGLCTYSVGGESTCTTTSTPTPTKKLAGPLYVVNTTSNTGSYSWTVGQFTQSGSQKNLQMPTDAGNYKIKICSTNEFCETSSNYFTIN